MRVLLVDDSQDNRVLVRHYLKRMPYKIDEAENGRIAIEMFTANPYDLVIMDLQMPEVDGYDATRTIRRWEREQGRGPIVIMALTAATLEENVRESLEAGCNLHIAKPIKRDALLRVIRDTMPSSENETLQPVEPAAAEPSAAPE